jgi:hypothetical protein
MKIKLIHTPVHDHGMFKNSEDLEKFFADNLQNLDKLENLEDFHYIEIETPDLTQEQINWLCRGRVQELWDEQTEFYPESDYYNYWVWTNKGSGYEFCFQQILIAL